MTIRSIPEISQVLEANNLPARLPTEPQGQFNCWNFTAYYAGWINRSFWMRCYEMEALLEKHTKPIKASEVKAGDIAVFRNEFGTLEHTAILLDKDTVCHKPGACALVIESLKAAKDTYTDIVTFVRSTFEQQTEIQTA